MALPAALALSGLSQENFSDSLNEVFSHGAVLLKSPSWSSMASSSEDTCSQESGISSMSSEKGASARNLGPYFDLLLESDQIELKAVEPAACSRPSRRPLKIVYQNRDLLDLRTNMTKVFFQPAGLRSGPDFFLANRSQYSRLFDESTPDHRSSKCPIKDCGFEEALHH